MPGHGPYRLVLVGFMGCGKSTFGPKLADALDWRYCDMDRMLEERLGMRVRDIFRVHGEPFFRTEERRLAVELASASRTVIAAGGGAFAQSETRAALKSGALTVWLYCSLPTILRRIGSDASRPLAQDRETISSLFAEREPFYRQADVTVDAEAAPGVVVDAILHALATARERGGAASAIAKRSRKKRNARAHLGRSKRTSAE